ncbi:MAG TPA: peptidyl-prolyl cis-trans isomerase [Solirubrobacterales bacterium]
MAAKGQRKGTPPKGKAPRRAAGRQRLWLVVFALIFALIFVIFAVAQGIGAPSVPSGDAAIVKGVPSDSGTISEAEVKRGTAQQIAAAVSEKKEKAPKPGSKKFEELQTAALGELLDAVWIGGEAEELGISVTDKQIEESLAEIKKQNFPTANAYTEFLEKSHFTQADVDARVELQVISTEIQERVQNQVPPPSSDEIQAYYDKELATQFTTPASRNVRVIVNKDESKVEAAKKELEGDQSEANWKKVAPKYSSDPTTKTNGGLQKAITEEFVKGDLKKAIFDSATGELVGPVEYEKNFLLIEPVKVNAEKVKKLPEVKSQISQTLAQTKQEEFFSEFVSQYQAKWTARTYCASGFTIERCSNFKGSGHPSSAPAACYEANPKTPAKECPAPVTMNTPAIPGTVSTATPKGERLVQRPQPEGLKTGEGFGVTPEAVSPESEAATGPTGE